MQKYEAPIEMEFYNVQSKKASHNSQILGKNLRFQFGFQDKQRHNRQHQGDQPAI